MYIMSFSKDTIKSTAPLLFCFCVLEYLIIFVKYIQLKMSFCILLVIFIVCFISELLLKIIWSCRVQGGSEYNFTS